MVLNLQDRLKVLQAQDASAPRKERASKVVPVKAMKGNKRAPAMAAMAPCLSLATHRIGHTKTDSSVSDNIIMDEFEMEGSPPRGDNSWMKAISDRYEVLSLPHNVNLGVCFGVLGMSIGAASLIWSSMRSRRKRIHKSFRH
mmetsp:Transcript_4339/g.11227  ORF Transcript_4339/g.11227 Transcript_4339/m.11227 type:complete len:142 (-) Transcript_4339:86-511(-)